ncbi:MAG: hydantoinase B/oxoprolinase family protein [Bdellovibrionales bacterium]|nr:hydantoinase B/oxoprolinase family protein [Bdellovibrionales bacterium]
MNTSFKSSIFHKKLKYLFSAAPQVSLLDKNGDCLYLKYEKISDLNSLTKPAKMCQQIFPVKLGDIYLTNDPQTGGALHSDFIFITPFSLNDKDIDGFLCLQQSFKPKVLNMDTSIQEVFKVPPMPVAQNLKLQNEILESMQAHPDCPQDFLKHVSAKVEKLEQYLNKIKALFEKSDFSERFLKNYQLECKKQFVTCMESIPVGEFQETLKLSDKSEIKLKLSIEEDLIVYDFNGTTEGKKLFLTESMAESACYASSLALVNSSLPVTESVLSVSQILIPKSSLLSANAQQFTFWGCTQGTQWISNLCLKTINQIFKRHKKPSVTAVSGASTVIDLEFQNKKHYYQNLSSGAPATPNNKGETGVNIWFKSHLEESIEQSEQLYPIKIKSFSQRPNSAGDGANTGGLGITQVIKVLEDARLSWGFLSDKPKGADGGKDAQNSDVILMLPNGERQKLEYIGYASCPAQSQVVIHSPGGGGFGDL